MQENIKTYSFSYTKDSIYVALYPRGMHSGVSTRSARRDLTHSFFFYICIVFLAWFSWSLFSQFPINCHGIVLIFLLL